MNYLLQLFHRFQRALAFDEECNEAARQMISTMGNEGALRYCRTCCDRAKGPDVDRWRDIEKAIRDSALPHMPYHL